jgi:hypothetical protein
MSSRFCTSSIVVLISTHSIIGIHLPLVESHPRNTHDCLPCYRANINAFQSYHFVLEGVVVDLPMNNEKAVALKVLITFLEEFQSESGNLHTRKRLHAVLLAATNARHKVD